MPNDKVVGGTDMLSILKDWKFSLLLRIRLHSLQSGWFCKNLLRSLKVTTWYSITSLGVPVLPLHASLSTCNWNMPLPVLCLTGTQRRSQPLTEDFVEEISIMPFFRTYPMDYLLIPISWINIVVSQFIHIASPVAFLLI